MSLKIFFEKTFLKEGCNNSIIHWKKFQTRQCYAAGLKSIFGYMNTASHFSSLKKFFQLFSNHWNILPLLMSWYIWEAKKFFQMPKSNIIGREKIFKPFDKFPVVKIFKIIYHTTVTMFLLSLAKTQLL